MPISNGHRPNHETRRSRALNRAPARQRGVALILALLLAVTAASFVMLSALNNRASRETSQRLATATALGEARRALIGYAVGYANGDPDRSPEKGPGRLPCPDLAGGGPLGVAETAGDCRAANDRETGLLPFRTLGLTALTDGSGAPLWYAVSDNFRNMTTGVVNSNSTGSFAVDDTDDVAAVIIAPGPPLVAQSRDSSTRYNAGVWLEGENASLGDNRYTRNIHVANNDTVMIITRAELMAEVMKVVNREVAQALSNYYQDPDGDDVADVDPDCSPTAPACDNAMPWLVPSSASNNVSVVGEGRARLARVPLVQLNKDFDAGFNAGWSLDGTGTVLFTGSEAPSEDCLRHSACTQSFNDKPGAGPPTPTPVTFPALVLGTNSAPWGQGSCLLLRAKSMAYALNISCTTSYSFAVPGRNLRREWQFDIGGNTRLVPPTISARRTIEVRGNGSWPTGTLARITISDFEGSKLLGAARLEFTSFASGDAFTLSNVPFDLEVWNFTVPIDRRLSPGALPKWLFFDQWLDSVLVRYASSEAPGYSGPSCEASSSCLTLRMSHPGDAAPTIVTGLRGVVVSPGPALPAQSAPSLEGRNKDPNTSTYERDEPSSTFNDEVLPLYP